MIAKSAYRSKWRLFTSALCGGSLALRAICGILRRGKVTIGLIVWICSAQITERRIHGRNARVIRKRGSGADYPSRTVLKRLVITMRNVSELANTFPSFPSPPLPLAIIRKWLRILSYTRKNGRVCMFSFTVPKSNTIVHRPPSTYINRCTFQCGVWRPC